MWRFGALFFGGGGRGKRGRERFSSSTEGRRPLTFFYDILVFFFVFKPRICRCQWTPVLVEMPQLVASNVEHVMNWDGWWGVVEAADDGGYKAAFWSSGVGASLYTDSFSNFDTGYHQHRAWAVCEEGGGRGCAVLFCRHCS